MLTLCFFILFLVQSIHGYHYSWDWVSKLGTSLIPSLLCLKSSKVPLMGQNPGSWIWNQGHSWPSPSRIPPSVPPYVVSTHLSPSLHSSLLPHSQATWHMQFSARMFLSAPLKTWFHPHLTYLDQKISTQEKPHALGRGSSEMFAFTRNKICEDTHCYELSCVPPCNAAKRYIEVLIIFRMCLYMEVGSLQV